MGTSLLGQGVVVSIDNAGSTPVTIGGVTGFSFSEGAASDIITTDLSDTAVTKRQGLQDFGDGTIELNRNPDDLGQIEMLSAKNLQSTRTFIVTFNDASTIDTATFEGYVKSVPTTVSTDDIAKGSATIGISGAVVWSA